MTLQFELTEWKTDQGFCLFCFSLICEYVCVCQWYYVAKTVLELLTSCLSSLVAGIAGTHC
jgi:hypothetical protein